MRLPGSILQGILARYALTFLRIYLGVALIHAAWLKLERGYPAEPAHLIAWGELLVGCCLVLGLGTRLAAALAFLLALDLTLAQGTFWTVPSPYLGWAMVSLALLVGAAGRTFGLDAFLAVRWPRSPLW